ncbi:MAG: hypothetical protein DCE90_15425 [Pseudanabaena sp.]|nr:MAG: hypothetical protein DCE90_15425 [Pseudanabaena sp.]
MGTWGNRPWDNDAAADWFGETMDTTQLCQKVEEALNLDIEDYYEEVRAAASILLLLGHNYVWSVGDLDRHLELAATKLTEILDANIFEGAEEFTKPIQEEIKVLRSRISKTENVDEVKWWQF